MGAKSGNKKTAPPKEESSRSKRKRDTAQSESPTSFSPPHKTRSRNVVKEDSPKREGTPSSSRGRSSKVTPEKSKATPSKSNPNETTPKNTRAKNTRASKNSPVTPKPTKTPSRTPKGSTQKTPTEAKSTPKSTAKAAKNSPARSPRASRRGILRNESPVSENIVSNEQPAKELAKAAASGRNRKRKKTESPPASPSSSSKSTEVKSELEVTESIQSSSRSNRRKKRKEDEINTTETVKKDVSSDNLNPDVLDSSSVIQNISKSPTKESEKILDNLDQPTESKSVNEEVNLVEKCSVDQRKIHTLPGETCRTAALCSIPSTAEISAYSNHSSHTNGNSSGIKRRFSNGNESDTETTDWTTKKKKSEVLMAATDDGNVVCGAVPVIHTQTLGSPCKSSNSNVRNEFLDTSLTNVISGSMTSPNRTVSPIKSSTTSTSKNMNKLSDSVGFSPTKSIKSSRMPLSSKNEINKLSKTNLKTNENIENDSSKKSSSTFKSTVPIVSSKKPTKQLKAEITDMDCDANHAEKLLATFNLNQNQIKEIANLLPDDIKDGNVCDILEKLVEKLLEENCSCTSMNAPRLNKLLRQLLTHFCSLDATVEKKHAVCETALSWARERKTMNLRHELELTLMHLYYDTNYYKKAEETANALYKETKKLQDKEKTVKACLCLSKTYHAMGNISKARANITTAKTEALKIYTPPDLQAELDLQSGIMQISEEKDMETAFSYFKEAATGSTIAQKRSLALKYMLLAKLMINKSEDGEKAVRNARHIEDIDSGVEALLAITKASTSCSLADFKVARSKYKVELDGDLVVSGVLDHLYTKMMEKNLNNIIMPYERVQISYVAERIGLAREEVERRLSQMILDGELSAQLDHRDDCLYLYGPEPKDIAYERSIDTIKELDKTLSHLNRRVKQLL